MFYKNCLVTSHPLEISPGLVGITALGLFVWPTWQAKMKGAAPVVGKLPKGDVENPWFL